MYRPTSPYQPPPHDSQYPPRAYSPVPPPPAAPSIAPGSITYTTSVGSDGRTVYHPFKAVPASYQTSGGLVSGIQWMPLEATHMPPPGAQPATGDFVASWSRGQLGKEDGRVTDWGRDDEKRRKKEEKESKRYREQGSVDYDADLRKARERDAMARERRKSINAGAPSPGGTFAFPTSASGGYPGTVYPATNYSGYGERPTGVYAANPAGGPYARDSKYGYSDLDRQFNELDLDRRDRDRDRDYERERKLSRPSKYNPSEASAAGERTRAISGNLGSRPGDGHDTYGASGPYSSHVKSYSGSVPPHASPNMRAASPNPAYVPPSSISGGGYPGSNYSSSPAPRPRSVSIGPSAAPFGGSAPPGAYPRSRPASPMPVPIVQGKPLTPTPGGPYSSSSVAFPQVSPNMPAATAAAPVQQLTAPGGFSRPVNPNNAFTPFDIMKIQDMEKFWTDNPRMPPVLKAHDVHDEDWKRLMQDITLAWAGQLPVVEYGRTGQKPKRSALIKELVELWNSAFFNIRGVEMVLYKGQERCTGPRAGMIDKDLPYLNEKYSSESEDSETSDDSDFSDHGSAAYRNVYGQNTPGQPLAGVYEAGRLRKEAKMAAKAEKKRRRHEKHRRRREKYRQRKYTLYLTCLSGTTPGQIGTTVMPGMPMNMNPGMSMNPGVPYGAASPGYVARPGLAGSYSPSGY